MNYLLSAIVVLALSAGAWLGVNQLNEPTLGAQPALTVPQGGTGWSNIQAGTYLTGNGTGRLATSTCAEITGSADLCDGNDASGAGSSGLSTTSPWSVGQLAMVSSNAAVTGVSTTTLTASSPLALSQAISVIGGSASSLTLDTSGSWTGNAGTATALAADPANCSSGQAPLGIAASGAVQSCFDVWTEAENTAAGYVASTRALTVAGTANQITSSAGSQTLAADRTWTLSLPAHVIFPGNFQATNATTTNATTTALDITNRLTFGGVTGTAWATFCESITGSAGLCDGNDASGGGGSAYEIATTSDIAVSQVAYINKVSGLTTLASVATGTVSSANSALTVTGSRYVLGGSLALTVSTTTTNMFTGTPGQVLAYTSAGWTGVATTTFSSGLTFSGGNVTADLGTSITVGELASADFGSWTCNGATCTIDSQAVTAAMLANADFGNFTVSGGVATIDNGSVTNAMLANSTISGIALGSNLANLTATDSTLTFSGTYTGATARTIGLNLGNANTWTALQQFSRASSTIHSSYLSYFGGTATTTIDLSGNVALPAAGTLTVPALTSALILTNGSGLFGEYTGIDCTNQFVRDVSAAGAGTCATIGAADVDLADLTATNASLTFSGAYDGQTARTVGVNLAHDFAWTGSHDFGGATFLEIPNGTAPTANDPGEVAHDTTGNQLILDDYVVAQADNLIWSRTIASTSPAFLAAGLMPLPTRLDGFTVTRIQCHVVTGTSKVIAIEDASGNSSEDITCATTNTTDDGSITNATYTASELAYIDFGATTGSVDYVNITVYGQWTRE